MSHGLQLDRVTVECLCGVVDGLLLVGLVQLKANVSQVLLPRLELSPVRLLVVQLHSVKDIAQHSKCHEPCQEVRNSEAEE